VASSDPDGAFAPSTARESADRHARFSFVGYDPDAVVSVYPDRTEVDARGPAAAYVETSDGDTLDRVRAALPDVTRLGFPDHERQHLDGGLVGFLAYDAVYDLTLSEVGVERPDPVVPDAEFLLTTRTVVFDDHTDSVRLVFTPIVGPEDDPDAVYDELAAEAAEVQATLADATPPETGGIERVGETAGTRADYEDAVRTTKRHVLDGDIYQGVISRTRTLQGRVDDLGLYESLREVNPSPYMYLLQHGDRSVIGASPETLVSVRDGRPDRGGAGANDGSGGAGANDSSGGAGTNDSSGGAGTNDSNDSVETDGDHTAGSDNSGHVVVNPVAGTCPRGTSPVDDRRLAGEMLADEKERAEHTMLVDLARNDVRRVSEPGSVRVDEFMDVLKYSHVQHIESTVTGTLAADADAFDATRATFPRGTLTGAPKVRAMEIIDELEETPRGIYGGGVGYYSWTGDSDLAIVIRTATVEHGSVDSADGEGGTPANDTDGRAATSDTDAPLDELTVRAGAGIVADSDPTSEYEETEQKMSGVLDAVERIEETTEQVDTASERATGGDDGGETDDDGGSETDDDGGDFDLTAGGDDS
jgi:anthranilate synthase component 1